MPPRARACEVGVGTTRRSAGGRLQVSGPPSILVELAGRLTQRSDESGASTSASSVPQVCPQPSRPRTRCVIAAAAGIGGRWSPARSEGLPAVVLTRDLAGFASTILDAPHDRWFGRSCGSRNSSSAPPTSGTHGQVPLWHVTGTSFRDLVQQGQRPSRLWPGRSISRPGSRPCFHERTFSDAAVAGVPSLRSCVTWRPSCITHGQRESSC